MALHRKLAHLTPEQVDDLIKRYYDSEKLTSLIEAFNIDAKPPAWSICFRLSFIKTALSLLPGHEPHPQAAGENARFQP